MRTKSPLTHEDTAFRRGYHQGVVAGLESSELPRELVHRWLIELADWRQQRHGLLSDPPTPQDILRRDQKKQNAEDDAA